MGLVCQCRLVSGIPVALLAPKLCKFIPRLLLQKKNRVLRLAQCGPFPARLSWHLVKNNSCVLSLMPVHWAAVSVPMLVFGYCPPQVNQCALKWVHLLLTLDQLLQLCWHNDASEWSELYSEEAQKK